MPNSLLLALICSHGALFLFGMFVSSALWNPRHKVKRFYVKDEKWNHPPFFD